MGIEGITSKEAKIGGFVIGLLGLLIDFLVSHFSDPGRGRAAAGSFASLAVAVRVFWHLRKDSLYWITITALALSHIVLIVDIPWTSKSIPAPALAPIGIADFFLIYGFVNLIQKLKHNSSTPDITAKQ